MYCPRCKKGFKKIFYTDSNGEKRFLEEESSEHKFDFEDFYLRCL